MNQRFDVFRKESEHYIEWVGTAASFADAGRLIRTDSDSTNAAEEEYVVVHSTYGTEAVNPLFENYVIHHHS